MSGQVSLKSIKSNRQSKLLAKEVEHENILRRDMTPGLVKNNESQGSPNPRIFSSISHIPSLFSGSGSSSFIFEIPARMKGKKIHILSNRLEDSINYSLSLPIEYLENELFALCREYYMQFDPTHITLKAFGDLHLLLKLLEIEDYGILNVNFTEILSDYLRCNQNSLNVYKFLKKFILLLNHLATYWSIINVYNYRARFKQELENSNLLDLEAIFTEIINPEVLWLSIIADISPLSQIFTPELLEIAKLLQSVFMDTLKIFIQSNNQGISKTSCIREWLSYKNPALHNKYSFPSPKQVPKPLYQELSFNMFSSLLRKPVSALKKQLESFELVYREFERSLLLVFVTIFGG